MKKLFILFVIALSINHLSAQHFGVKGGLNLAKIKASSEGLSVGFDNITSFHAGVVYDTPISSSMFLNTGVLFSQKGYKAAIMGLTDYTVRLNYIQVPINFAYKYETGAIKLFAQAGPFVSYAISGKSKGTVMDENVDGDIEFGSNVDEHKRLDYGLGIGAGIEINDIQLGIGYDIGLADIQNASDSKTKTRNIQFSACFFF